MSAFGQKQTSTWSSPRAPIRILSVRTLTVWRRSGCCSRPSCFCLRCSALRAATQCHMLFRPRANPSVAACAVHAGSASLGLCCSNPCWWVT